MALIQVNFVSHFLFRTVPMQVILPVDKLQWGEQRPVQPQKFKTLYLLHGLLGNYTDWVTGTRIQRWAEERDLAVVMPSGDNAFYVDQPGMGSRYSEFIGKELVEITRRMFPLSDKREDTFIGGLSMGGYGAVHNGLKYADTFGAIINLSGAMHIFEDNEPKSIGPEMGYFGDMAQARKSDKNPRVQVELLKKRMAADPAAALPKLFMACGTEDSLLSANRTLRDFFRENGLEVTYYESEGGHTWDFWDEYILKALNWLPLDSGKQGINSGNVVLEAEE